MTFIDAYVAAVPHGNRDAYIAFSTKMIAILKEQEALRVVETWESDVPEGKLTSFPFAVRRLAGEAIALGIIEWPSKEVRDRAWSKFDAEGVTSQQNNPMPYDGSRMIFGGFDTILDI